MRMYKKYVYICVAILLVTISIDITGCGNNTGNITINEESDMPNEQLSSKAQLGSKVQSESERISAKEVQDTDQMGNRVSMQMENKAPVQEKNKTVNQDAAKDELPDEENFISEKEFMSTFQQAGIESKIFPDLEGYGPQDDKVAYFVGENLEEEFSLRVADTNEIVYKGGLEKILSVEGSNKAVYIGDFSEYKAQGQYYLQTAYIGQSYEFSISDNHEKILLDKLLDEMESTGPEEYYLGASQQNVTCKEMLKICKSIFYLSMAAEMDENIQQSIKDSFADYEEFIISLYKENNESFQNDEMYFEMQAWFSAAMAQAAFLDKNKFMKASLAYQNAYSAYDYLKKATKEDNAEKELFLLASMAVYKAGGNYAVYTNSGLSNLTNSNEGTKIKVNSKTESSLALEDKAETNEDVLAMSETQMLSTILYLTTLYKVDVNISEKRMKQFLSCVSQDAKKYDNNNQYVNLAQMDDDAMSQKALLYEMADYIIVSADYRGISRNMIHQLLKGKRAEELDIDMQTKLIWILTLIQESENVVIHE